MTDYEREWQRQRARDDVPPKHLPVHRWYLQIDEPWTVDPAKPPRDGLTIIRAEKPGIAFYRFLYHTAGEEWLWGDRRRTSDEELLPLINDDDVDVMVLYDHGTPAGFFEMNYRNPEKSKINYFAILPDHIGSGLGGYLLNQAIVHAGSRRLPLVLDTCSLDHPAALENYKKRGFVVYREDDEIYPDPRLDGTIPASAGAHVPLAV